MNLWESAGGDSLYGKIRNIADKIGYSAVYVVVVAALALIANVWALDLPVYTLYVVMAVCIFAFCRDLLPIAPLVICGYIAPSIANNPGRNPESIFYPEHGGIFLLVLTGVLAVSLILRLSLDKKNGFKRLFTEKRALLWGMVALGAAYMLSGIGADGYAPLAGKNLFFALLQFLSIAMLYLIFTATVDWENVPRWYLPLVGVCVGLVLVGELVNVYKIQEVIVNGVIDRKRIYTGWGMYNNIGGMLIMMLPFPFYFACNKRYGWAGILASAVLLLGIGMTSSRGAILTGIMIYFLSTALTIVYSEDHKRTFWIFAVVLISMTVVLCLCWEQISLLLQLILSKGLETSRNEIFAQGIEQFKKYPIFGGSFYPIGFVPWDFSELEQFSSFFPPRWHNTVVQLLACCGIAGMAAYLLHCVQLVVMFLKKTSRLKAVIALSVLALTVSSLLDCHFFNIGPVLFYSIALAVAEKTPPAEDE